MLSKFLFQLVQQWIIQALCKNRLCKVLHYMPHKNFLKMFFKTLKFCFHLFLYSSNKNLLLLLP